MKFEVTHNSGFELTAENYQDEMWLKRFALAASGRSDYENGELYINIQGHDATHNVFGNTTEKGLDRFEDDVSFNKLTFEVD